MDTRYILKLTSRSTETIRSLLAFRHLHLLRMHLKQDPHVSPHVVTWKINEHQAHVKVEQASC